jgi:hypothetical protein
LLPLVKASCRTSLVLFELKVHPQGGFRRILLSSAVQTPNAISETLEI